MKLDVAIYLLRGDESALSVAEDHLIELGYYELPTLGGIELATSMVLLAKQHDEKDPDWVKWCTGVFETADAPKSASVGAVLLLVSEGRVFAVTFGTGWNGLPRDLVEPDFGVRVAMQLVSPDRLRSLVTKSVNLRSSEKDVYNHAGSELAQFPLDPESEWLRQTGGRVDGSQGFVAVRDTNSVRLVSYTKPVLSLPATCAYLLDKHDKEVPEAFQFYKHLRPLSKYDQKHRDLEEALASRLTAGQFDDVTVVLDRAKAAAAAMRQLKHGHASYGLSDVVDSEVWAGVADFAANVSEFELSKVRLLLKDADGKRVTNDPILRFVHAQITDADGTWIRMDGGWFRATSDYVARVESQLKLEIDDLTATLGMPAWHVGGNPTELRYNTSAATRKGWLLQDQKNIHVGNQSIEPCDLLTPDAHFIHLKNAEDSQHVGALVGQLRGAAYMMKHHDDFRQTMRQRYADHTGVDDLLEKRSSFVLGLARKPHLDVYGRMLVAKINIPDCGRRVRALGYDFGVCKVDRT